MFGFCWVYVFEWCIFVIDFGGIVWVVYDVIDVYDYLVDVVGGFVFGL